jgi:hypothetical protein
MTATLLPEGKQSFTNSAGAPLIGGKIYTYDAGTNIPRTTYQDAAGTVPNTNPVILDARGEATVFWSGVYKVVLKDAADVTLWVTDGIEDTNSPVDLLRSNLSASSGASRVGYMPAGVGSVATTVEKVLRETVSVYRFMTDTQIANVKGGTASMDMATVLQTAFVACAITGDDLDLVGGTFGIASSLGQIPPNFEIRGNKNVVIKATAVFTHMAQIGSTTAAFGYNQGAMSGVIWDGNSKVDQCLRLGSVVGDSWLSGYEFSGCTFKNATGDGVLTSNNYWLVPFRNCAFHNNGGRGYHQMAGDNAGENISFYGCSFFNNTAGGVLLENPGAGGASNYFYGCSFDYNGDWAIQNGTSLTNGIVYLSGGHIEQDARYIRNYGFMQTDGVAMFNGTLSASLGYLIDSYNALNMSGGWVQNAGAGVLINPASAQNVFARNVTGLYGSFADVVIPGGALVSGTVYQNTYPSTLEVSVPITYGAGIGSVASYVGNTNAPALLVDQTYNYGGFAVGTPVYHKFKVPPGWYYKLVATTGGNPAYINAGHVLSYF